MKNKLNGNSMFTFGKVTSKPSGGISPSNIGNTSGFSWNELISRATKPNDSSMNKADSTDVLKFGSIGKSYDALSSPSMSNLESASMRLADAAARRGIYEKESEANLAAREKGFRSLDEMTKYLREKRRKSEYMQ